MDKRENSILLSASKECRSEVTDFHSCISMICFFSTFAAGEYSKGLYKSAQIPACSQPLVQDFFPETYSQSLVQDSFPETYG